MKVWSFVLVLVLGLTTAGFAQTAASKDATTAPAKGAVKTIFDYQKDLGLSDKQVADVQALMADLQKTLGEKANEMKAMRQGLAQMIQNKEDMKAIRKHLEKIAALQVENSCLDIETSRKVEGVMTPAQWTKWKEIQTKAVEAAKAKAKDAKGKGKAPAKGKNKK